MNMAEPLQVSRFRYPYEEFSEHIRAMKTVREWQYTSRFGHLGSAQTSRANSARVVEYFADSYPDPKEAVYKADLFLLIYDYVGRHADLFTKKDLVEKLDGELFSVSPALLRAVHYVFTAVPHPTTVDPRKVLGLARAFEAIEND
jgi:hypothetical protein